MFDVEIQTLNQIVSQKQDGFSFFFSIVPFEVLIMLNHCNPTEEDGGILIFWNILYSISSFIVISKMPTTLVRFDWKN